MKQNNLNILLSIIIVGLLSAAAFIFTRPAPTALEEASKINRFTYSVLCWVRDVTPIAQSWKMPDPNKDGIGNDAGNGMPIEGKNPYKYSITCHIDKKEDVVPLNPNIDNAIPLPLPGDHGFEVTENTALTLVNFSAAPGRVMYPINSEGMYVYPLPLRDWATKQKITLHCWEETSTSSGNPEPVCRLQ